MAKQYKIECGNFSEEFTARQYCDAKSRGLQFSNAADARFFLRDTEVSFVEFIAACNDGVDAWFSKKQETHKRVSVQHGVLPTSRVWIWIRK